MSAPVVFIFFNKVETTQKVFAEIAKRKPDKLYLVSDGGREGRQEEGDVVKYLRNFVESNINWEANVVKIYSDTNKGCKRNVIDGISKVFEHEDTAIIIEDDCLPCDAFFDYCEHMLDIYRDDERIMMINGSNLVSRDVYKVEHSIVFTQNVWVWGWATWKRAWSKYDENIIRWPQAKRNKNAMQSYKKRRIYKYDLIEGFDAAYRCQVDTWDFQWVFSIWINNGLAISPCCNLIENLGFNCSEATHTKNDMPDYIKKVYLEGGRVDEFKNLPQDVCVDKMFDRKYDNICFPVNRCVKIMIKQILKMRCSVYEI